jgi:hypothetical protein
MHENRKFAVSLSAHGIARILTPTKKELMLLFLHNRVRTDLPH